MKNQIRTGGLFLHFVAAVTLTTAPVVRAQEVIFVNHAALGAYNGTSWADAFVSLQDALAEADTGDQIWVASGRYRPDIGEGRVPGDRSETFQLAAGVMLLGGFAGTESSYSERKTDLFKSILSGDLAENDHLDFAFREDNAFHVVTASGTDENTLLDGFLITGGNANGVDADSLGGGLHIVGGSPAIMNTTLVSNFAIRGGGAYLEASSSELVNVVFSGNGAALGGALYLQSSNAKIINTTIASNFAEVGAGIYNVDSSPVVVNSTLTNNGSKSGYLECQRAGYVCTLAEMDPDVVWASVDLSEEVRDRMQSESISSANEWLRLQPEVVFVGGGDQSILFRLRGGPRMWVLGESALAGKTSQIGGVATSLSKTIFSRQEALTYLDVVGEDTNSDGKRNNRDKKKALLLSPFETEFQYDDGQYLNDLFASNEVYSGEVDFFASAEAGFDRFQGWDRYDVVHVSSHGARECTGEAWPSSCYNTIVTGTMLDAPSLDQSIQPGMDLVNIPGLVNNMSTDRLFISLGKDFFLSNYSQGLERTLVTLSACETGDGDTGESTVTAPDLGNAILYGGNSNQSTFSNSVFYGWDEVVQADLAFVTHTLMYEFLLVDVWPTVLAENKVKASGYGTGENENGHISTLRRWSKPDHDLYILEMVTLSDDLGAPIGDGANVTSYVDGIVDDGEPDDLLIDVVVKGIPDGTASQFEISFELDGVLLEPPVSFPSADVFRQVSDFTYAIKDRVPAGRDLESMPTYTLEAIVSMPGGGQSRYEATDLVIDNCYWELAIGGTRAGTYTGEMATFSTFGGALQVLLQSIETNPISSVFLNQVPEVGSSGTYSMEVDDTGDGSAVINFVSLYTSPPFQYITGNGDVEMDVDDMIVFTRPGPSTMVSTRLTTDRMKGALSGEVFAWTNLDPFHPTFESTPFSLKYVAEISHNPDETPRLNVCTGG